MNIIAHIEIPVRDLDWAMKLYSSVFGLDFVDVVVIHGSKMA